MVGLCCGSPGADASAASCLTCAPPCVLTLQIGGGQTINANVLKVAVGVIQESRQLRLQPFNEYRKRFGMKPYKSFQELTGRTAVLLQEFSGLCSVLTAEYETMSCPPATGLAQQSSRSCPSKPGLVVTLAPGWTGLMPWLQGSFLLRGWTSGPEGSAWPGSWACHCLGCRSCHVPVTHSKASPCRG